MSFTAKAVSTNVPIPAELATRLAQSTFPFGVELTQGNLFLSEPEIIFIDADKLALRARVQAYDHRPAAGIALSEMGWAQITAAPGFDAKTRQILLHNAKLQSLDFDRQNAATEVFKTRIRSDWTKHISNPIQAPLPDHPFLAPIRRHITNLSYDGDSINLTLEYR